MRPKTFAIFQIFFFCATQLALLLCLPLLAKCDYAQNSYAASVKFIQKRQMVNFLAFRWPRRIPYSISADLNEKEKETIKRALEMWAEKSCLEFEENANAWTRMHFVRGTQNQCGMGAPLLLGTQKVELFNADNIAVVAHEIGHALGMDHAHSRRDYQKHVEILKDSIKSEKYSQFEKSYLSLTYGVPYDMASIMHYGKSDFKKETSQNPSIRPVMKIYEHSLGQTDELTFADILLINLHYKCYDVCEGSNAKLECAWGGFPNPKDCATCICPSGFPGPDCNQIGKKGYCGKQFQAENEWQKFDKSIRSSRQEGKPFQKCNFHIQAPKNRSVEMIISEIEAECDSECNFGYAEIRIAKEKRTTGIKLCCKEDLMNNEVLQLISESELVVVNLHSRWGKVRLKMQYRHVEQSADAQRGYLDSIYALPRLLGIGQK